jgi:hypothetical protein
MRRTKQSEPAAPAVSEIDWLAVAIYNMGGIKGAAKRMGVKTATICNWLKQGDRRAHGPNPSRNSERGNVPACTLLERRGPWPTVPKLRAAS